MAEALDEVGISPAEVKTHAASSALSNALRKPRPELFLLAHVVMQESVEPGQGVGPGREAQEVKRSSIQFNARRAQQRREALERQRKRMGMGNASQGTRRGARRRRRRMPPRAEASPPSVPLNGLILLDAWKAGSRDAQESVHVE